MAITATAIKLRVDVNPYFKRIADYYWDHLDPSTDGSIWDWLKRDYDVIKIGPIKDRDGKMWVVFPNESSYAMFLLRWA